MKGISITMHSLLVDFRRNNFVEFSKTEEESSMMYQTPYFR